MKHNRISALTITLFLAGCSSVMSPIPTQLEATSTFTPALTSTSHLTATATIVPILTEMSCEPSSNPFVKPPAMSESEYGASLYPNITITRVCSFIGHISRGQIYKHQITNGLVFCLVPSGIFSEVPDEGWSIVISDSSLGGCDFNSKDYLDLGHIITPPFRGNLYFDVYGWHFRNRENTGDNDGSVNAPQEERYFNFLFNRKDFDAVWHASRCAEWGIPDDCALATKTPAGSSVFIPRSRAHFTITKLELGNLVQNSYAWIEYMEFKVEIYLPAE